MDGAEAVDRDLGARVVRATSMMVSGASPFAATRMRPAASPTTR